MNDDAKTLVEKVAGHARGKSRERYEDEWVFLDTVLDQMPIGVLIVEAGTEKVLLRNKKFNDITAMPEIDRFPEYEKYYTAHYEDGRKYTPEECPILRSIRLDETITDEEMTFRHASGAELPLSVNSAPILDNEGHVVAGVATYGDISERALVESHIGFLSEAGAILASSFDVDHDILMHEISQLVVDWVADGCSIDVVRESGAVELAAIHYRDPEKKKIALQIRKQGYRNADLSVGVGMVLRTGRSALYHKIQPAAVKDIIPGEMFMHILSKSGFTSALIVPIKMKDTVIGAITMVSTDESRLFEKNHLRLAEELAKRISLNAENRRLHKAAQQEIAARTDLINMASHELRTPITSMAMQIYAMKSHLKAEPIATILAEMDEMDGQLTQLKRLIDTLLDLSRIERGRLVYKKFPFDMNILIRELAAQAQRITTRHTIAVIGDAGKSVYGDRERIGSVITNIIVNAIKFSSGGVILISSSTDDKLATVSITDSGVGISEEEHAKIFDQFYQGGDPRYKYKSYPGMGLGLYIAAEIVRNHGGTIWVESRPEKGSTFYFTVPLFEPSAI